LHATPPRDLGAARARLPVHALASVVWHAIAVRVVPGDFARIDQLGLDGAGAELPLVVTDLDALRAIAESVLASASVTEFAATGATIVRGIRIAVGGGVTI
jgi:hypothetical protein